MPANITVSVRQVVMLLLDGHVLVSIEEKVGQECHLTVQTGLQTETATLSVLNVENSK
jgi:hypothetical protein